MLPDANHPCPCGRLNDRARPLTWGACCGRYVEHWAERPAPDAETLMRSRYSAFVAERADYLQATWAPEHRPATLDFDTGVKWLGLEVRSHQVTGPDQAEVEFVARWRLGGRAVRLHERSRFERRVDAQGVPRWWYLNGEQF